MSTKVKYGKASMVSAEDREWMRDFDKAIWKRSKDEFGCVHSFEKDDRKVKSTELKRVLALITKHRLPCILHSGPYAGLSMAIMDHADDLGKRPDQLMVLGEHHVPFKDYSFKTWDMRFKWFERYTHSEINKSVLEFYDFPAPAKKERYEY